MEKKDRLPPPYYPLRSDHSASLSSSSPQTLQESSQRFSHDVSQMPDFPSRNRGHRRAQSEILSLPDDLTFDADLGVLDPNDEMEEDILAMYLDMDKIGSSPGLEIVDGENLGVHGGVFGVVGGGSSGSVQNERPRVRHQHSQSMDGSSSIKPELLGSCSEGSSSFAEAKKAMSAEKLADLALADPKKAKRIWANRQSAARSKERKMRYIGELERKVQTLQSEATTLSAQLTMLQRDTTGLTAENSELKLRLQTMEQQVHLQDALNETLREEVQRLKVAAGQMMPNGPMMNYGAAAYHNNNNHNQAMQQSLIAARQFQQMQIRPQHHQQQQSGAELRGRGTLNQRESSNNPSTG